MNNNTLHITNGDSTASLLVAAEVNGDVLPWRDVLHDGPVPGGLTLGELSKVRAAFLSESFAMPLGDTERDIALRDEHLRGCDRYADVILWFEHDLYDQLQILQLLDWFHANPVRHARLALICIDRFTGIERFVGLGQLNPAQVATLQGTEVVITPELTATAARGWQAFTHADPSRLAAYADGALPGLSFMRAAIVRLLQEFPHRQTGTSRTQQQILEIIAGGEERPGQVFAQNQSLEPAPYMGDWSFWQRVSALCSEPNPLLGCTPDPFRFPPRQDVDNGFRDQRLSLTTLGKQVLAGTADWLQVHPIDVWLGGTHLTSGAPVWRWNSVSGTVEADP